ncbi:hypothetical protein AAHA92_18045 [Salvia divinorum]|uniref:Uncharacterized protein n=1 Tax=Salvia divinorum TaxID=28513 RepID=A0ABD1H0T2_SALDI
MTSALLGFSLILKCKFCQLVQREETAKEPEHASKFKCRILFFIFHLVRFKFNDQPSSCLPQMILAM